MLPRGAAVLVGVSGGPDSMALLDVLRRLSGPMSFRVGAVHLNHCLRPGDADADAAFVADYAREHRIPCYIGKADVRLFSKETSVCLEEGAREARYRFFEKTRRDQGYDSIAVGHHQEDTAELMLMFLLRGSGVTGLKGIAPVRGRIIRPLIRAGRPQIDQHLATHGIPFREDASNRDPKFLRNRIRHELLPLLRRDYNPAITAGLNRLGEILEAEDQWVESLVSPYWDQVVMEVGLGRITLNAPFLAESPLAARRRLARRAIASVKKDLRAIGYRHINALLRLAAQPSGAGRLDLPGGIRAVRQGKSLTLTRENAGLRHRQPVYGLAPQFYFYTVSKAQALCGFSLTIAEIHSEVRFCPIPASQVKDLRQTGKHQVYFDLDRVRFPISIRPMRPGDRFTPLGMAGTQCVNRFFTNNKVPLAQRPLIPLFFSGETLVWIGGWRMADGVKAGPDTRNLLSVLLAPRK